EQDLLYRTAVHLPVPVQRAVAFDVVEEVAWGQVAGEGGGRQSIDGDVEAAVGGRVEVELAVVIRVLRPDLQVLPHAAVEAVVQVEVQIGLAVVVQDLVQGAEDELHVRRVRR